MSDKNYTVDAFQKKGGSWRWRISFDGAAVAQGATSQATKQAALQAGQAIADKLNSLETLTRTVGDLIGRVVNLEKPKAEAERPTPPKPKCPWCGSAVDIKRGEERFVGLNILVPCVCTNQACKAFFLT